MTFFAYNFGSSRIALIVFLVMVVGLFTSTFYFIHSFFDRFVVTDTEFKIFRVRPWGILKEEWIIINQQDVVAIENKGWILQIGLTNGKKFKLKLTRPGRGGPYANYSIEHGPDELIEVIENLKKEKRLTFFFHRDKFTKPIVDYLRSINLPMVNNTGNL